MNQQKGFSLFEVLISLTLVSTLGLILIEQQLQSRQFLTHIVLRSQASQFLDQVDESLIAGTIKIPPVPVPYQFSFQKQKTGVILRLSAFKDFGSISREYVAIARVE